MLCSLLPTLLSLHTGEPHLGSCLLLVCPAVTCRQHCGQRNRVTGSYLSCWGCHCVKVLELLLGIWGLSMTVFPFDFSPLCCLLKQRCRQRFSSPSLLPLYPQARQQHPVSAVSFPRLMATSTVSPWPGCLRTQTAPFI